MVVVVVVEEEDMAVIGRARASTSKHEQARATRAGQAHKRKNNRRRSNMFIGYVL